MWQKPLVIIILFYLFVLLQNSFFIHFNLFGTAPNLVFILFFLLAFFAQKDEKYQVIFLAVTAGFFLDLFLYTYLGPSIILLTVVGFLLKGMQSLLKNREDNYPFVYFLPLFIAFLLIFDLSLGLYFYLLDPNKIIINIGAKIVFEITYNSLIVSILFYIYKRFLNEKI